MYKILSASKDCYITNKILNNKFRTTDANVGQAGTLDLFKLYNESTLPGETYPIELTRLLLKFNLESLKTMQSKGTINVGDSSFKAEVHLHDVYGGQTTPTNFTAVVFPLAKEFDEGSGFDIVEFKDLGMANYISASYPANITSAVATGTITIANGNAASGMSEKQTIKIKSASELIKTYVVVDSNKTSVATGDILTDSSSTGDGTAGTNLSGGVAIAIDLTGSPSTQNAFLVQLKNAIVGSSGHGGVITSTAVPGSAGESQSIILTQVHTGYSGNNSIENTISNVTVSGFTGGKGGVLAWSKPGAMASGSLGDSNIDVITSGTIAGQSAAISLCGEQKFINEDQDLKIDVTKFVSASIKNLISNKGFLVSLSGSYEKDTNSYFVKRFASRNTANTSLRPKLVIKYDDSISDNHGNFIFDYTGSLYLNNLSRSDASNIKKVNNDDIAPTGAMILKIRSGSFSKNFSVSQALRGTERITGLYSSSFALSSYDTTIKQALKTNTKLTFDAIWSSTDETVTYLSSSVDVSKNERTSVHFRERRLLATTLNLNDRYVTTDLARIRLFIENADRTVVYTKGPIDKPSEIFENVHYSVKDFISGKVLIPFDTENNSTKLSSDSHGMYYDFYMSSLPRGRTYVFEYLVIHGGVNTYIKDAASKFIVE